MLKSTHIVKPVGKLYKNDTNVLCHSKKHFPEVFNVSFFLGNTLDFIKLCHTLNQKSYLLSEFLFHEVVAVVRIFYNIMQKPRYNCLSIKLHFRKYAGNLIGMHKIRFSAVAKLVTVFFFAQGIRFKNQASVLICIFIIFFYFLHQGFKCLIHKITPVISRTLLLLLSLYADIHRSYQSKPFFLFRFRAV